MNISVIMSVYNTQENWLREAIKSILNQTYRDFEFIIVWDCATDNSLNIIKEYAETDNRIILIKNESNMGLTKSLCKALKIASGKYIARMDADDVSVPYRLEKQIKYMERHPEVTVLGGHTYIESNEKNSNSFFIDNKGMYKIQLMFKNGGIAHPTAFIRKSFLINNNITYNENIRKSQDYQLWYDIIKNGGTIQLLPEILLVYRIHENQISNGKSNQNRYADMVKLTALHDLVGECDKIYQDIHCNIYEGKVFFALKDYNDYFNLLKNSNKTKQYYDKRLFKQYLNFLWLKTGFQFLRRNHSFKYLFTFHSLCCFNALPFLYTTYFKAPQLYKKAVKEYMGNANR